MRSRSLWRRFSDFLDHWHWVIFGKARASTVEAIRRRKEEQARSGLIFQENPRLSLVVQSFNQESNIARLAAALRRTGEHELIVCEDGSLDGSHGHWMKLLTRPNDFLIHSNDLHEIRTYNRVLGLARGEIVCLIQDDDRPPSDGSWSDIALRLFQCHPKLAILGGWMGFNDFFEEAWNSDFHGARAIAHRDPASAVPFMFVENVNIGPYWVRRDVFHRLGGFDRRFSEVGEPGICFEADLCYRAWLAGYQVGLINVPFGKEKFRGGTILWGKSVRQRQEMRNKALLTELYSPVLADIQEQVRLANEGLLRA